MRASFPSPCGPVVVEYEEAGLTGLSLPGQGHPVLTPPGPPLPFLAVLARELEAYFRSEPVRFTAPLCLRGLTPFQLRVLAACREIPYGEVRTYGWLAARVGSPRAARAVGQVMAANPVPLVIPCHRVVAAGGKLGGFGGGLPLKAWLLAHEGVSGFLAGLPARR
jgi:methylated-DNA-[protein]-cysteine S-methyltransferase